MARGLPKKKWVALWCALAYNVMHFGAALLQTASCDKETTARQTSPA